MKRLKSLTLHAFVLGAALIVDFQAPAADQPQWGRAWSRNMVSSEKGLPDSFDPKTGKNIKWSVALGTEAHSSPVISGGHVFIGTNNGNPRDPKHQGDRGVLMCFDEKTGELLWQLVVPKRDEDVYFDWPQSGISSPATVESDRVYIVSNRGEVLCLDGEGLRNGNDGPFRAEAAHMTPHTESHQLTPGPLDADIVWLLDLPTQAGIWSHDAAHSSILIDGGYLYLNSGTGVDNTHKRIRTPEAPSLVVLDKRTGKLVARDYEHIAPNIFHSTWCAPSMAEVNGRRTIFFGGGNGILYAFEALSQSGVRPDSDKPIALKKLFQFDFDPDAPKTNVHRYNSNRQISPSNFYGMPVFNQNRIYLAGGGDLWWGKNQAWLKCIDATKTGDSTTNGLIWSYVLEKHVMGTPAVLDGMVFIADCGRKFHCVDAGNGKAYWTSDINGEAWASPLAADGKVYIGTRSGNFYVFAISREMKLLSSCELGQPISSTAAAANGVLYVATMNRLYAVQAGANSPRK
ncbi:MAG TPA: PQQ-binding-like beta-propeller repeat protein [Patescibacteria group bacterium]|nr:PQQ-binding-like beta-propeller repeat protein [Patescibacteria group bacterium]